MSVDDPAGVVTHLADHRRVEEIPADAEMRLAKILQDNFREQTDLIREHNKTLEQQNQVLSDKIGRLLTGMERLLGEVQAVRTGDQEEAFARVARHDEGADILPSISADFGLLYPHTSEDVGKLLGFCANEVGLLLGQHGLRWNGDGAYTETTRWRKGRQRFWHLDVPAKLKVVLSTRDPDEFGITNKAVRAIFRKYRGAPNS